MGLVFRGVLGKGVDVPRYHYDVSISRQKRFIRRFKKFLLALVGIGIVVGALIILDTIRQNLHENNQQGAPSTTTIRPSIREFDSAYFTFMAPPAWTSVEKESTATKFVYQSYRGQLVEQELTIYINDSSADLSATRVLPVRVENSQRIIPTQVSEHCSTASSVKSAHAPVPVSFLDTTILCQLDGTNYLVVIAEKGGGPSIQLNRADKSMAGYSFLYRSSTVPPDTTQLINILNSFTPL
jgi:hypothetical protein